jgi:acid stress-induced BolA-like protein IbaG/YrbA
MPFNAVFAHIIKKRLPRISKYASSPIVCQKEILKDLLDKARNTEFGSAHHFSTITTIESFKSQVPLSDYDALYPLIKKQIDGQPVRALRRRNYCP